MRLAVWFDTMKNITHYGNSGLDTLSIIPRRKKRLSRADPAAGQQGTSLAYMRYGRPAYCQKYRGAGCSEKVVCQMHGATCFIRCVQDSSPDIRYKG
jgi:hypothetical protein